MGSVDFELHWRVICLGYLLWNLQPQHLRSFLRSSSVSLEKTLPVPAWTVNVTLPPFLEPGEKRELVRGSVGRSSAFSCMCLLNPYFQYCVHALGCAWRSLVQTTSILYSPKKLTSGFVSAWRGGRYPAVRIWGRVLET